MKISVIIPTFNRESTLARALDSVYAQSRLADEVIVIDDGSSDKTRALIYKTYPQVRYIYQENQGVSAARNAGIKAAVGDWIALLDSDDEWHIDKLAQQEQTIGANPDYQFCHTNEVWIRDGVRVNSMMKHQKSGGRCFIKSLKLCMISPSSVLLHQSLFNDVGLFDESLPACEDYDFWLRICAKYQVLYLGDRLTYKYGGHEDQLSKRYWGMDRFRIQALIKLKQSPDITDEERAALNKVLIKKITVYLNGAIKRNKTDDINTFTELQHHHRLKL